MAAAMNVSQTPPSFCNCARRAPSKIAEVFGHFFAHESYQEANFTTFRAFFFHKTFPKIHSYHMKVFGALKLPSPSLDGSIQKYIGSDFWHFFKN